MRVLFIGNSYTYFGQLPDMVADLAATGQDGLEIVCESVTEGGITLEWHWNNSPTLEAIQRGGWDVVVMQEQSTRAVRERHMTIEYARRLAQEIRAVGAEPMLYCSWAREHIPEMLAPLAQAYADVGQRINAKVAPVGRAFAAVRERLPELGLYTSDHSHPSPAGSYLAACVFYAMLAGVSPVGLAPSSRTGDRVLVELDDETARCLQNVAWQVCQGQ